MKNSVFVTIPVEPNGTVDYRISHWLLVASKWCQENGWDFRYQPVLGKPVCSTRNQQVHEFLKTDASVCFFMDSDAVPDLEGFQKLLASIVRDDVDIVGGWSLMTGGNSAGVPVVLGPAAQDAKGCPLDPLAAHSGELREITGGGLGAHCLMAKRAVFQAFAERSIPWFSDVYYDDYEKDGKKFGTRSWGHDILFCRRAAEYGFRVWLDASVFWGHVKPMDLRDWYHANVSYHDEIASHLHITRLVRKLWGNSDWAAGEVFLLRMVYEASRIPEDSICLECGSGLTTALLGSVLPKERLVVMEEDQQWFESALHFANGYTKSIHFARLEDKGEYDWYRLPDLGDRKIGLVVCDGPRGSTRGGRYGALPELWPHLADEFLVLLDDVHRDQEQAIVQRWLNEHPEELKVQLVKDGDKAFAAVLGQKET